MAVSVQQVEAACQNIGRFLESFGAAPDRPGDLQRCLEGLDWLRQVYREERALLAPYMDRVKDLSRQVHEALAAAREKLAGQYLEALAAVAAWQEIREACRDALVELAEAQNASRLESPSGWIEVKRARTISLPKNGTPQREQLCDILTRADRWADVSLPNPARLLKAMDAGLFAADQVGELSRLCPVRTLCRLVAHPSGRASAEGGGGETDE
jgi:hypothetical protein